MTQRYNAAFLAEPEARERFSKVFGSGRLERIKGQVNAHPELIGTDNFEQFTDELADVRFLFSTWGTPKFTAAQLRCLPRAEALFYAAGSVQYFARPYLGSGIKVISAWKSISVPVTAYTIAQIVLASKGYFRAIRDCATLTGRLAGKTPYPGLSPVTIAILGAGTIGSMVIEGLAHYPYKIIVFDPFLSEARAAELNVVKVSLEEAFARGFIVSNHLANLPATENMLKGEHFRKLPANATFINTGRGATVEEEAMLDVLAERPDITALLDVTWPEPPVAEGRFFDLPNVFLTPHIAGSQGDEILLQADYAIAEFERYLSGDPLRYNVTEQMLETMA